MKKKEVDWELFQRLHDEGITVKKLCEDFGISITIVFKARKAGLFFSRKHKHSVSEETKKKISEGRKTYCKNNPRQHAWSLRHKVSVPCNIVKQYLRDNGVAFLEEYRALEDRFFQIDIAFPDRKVGIEINGNQHYDEHRNLKPYYQERHDLITAAGWTLIELHFSVAFNNEQLETLVHQIKNDLNIQNADYTFFIKQRKKDKRKYGSMKDYHNQKYQNYANPIIDKIKNSDIDFSKLGWVTEVSKLTGLLPQKVNRFMKRYMPDFLKSCYQRNKSKN